MTEDYQPFGNEWETEMMKLSKANLIAFIKRILLEQEKTKKLMRHIEEAINQHPDAATDGDMIDEVQRLIGD